MDVHPHDPDHRNPAQHIEREDALTGRGGAGVTIDDTLTEISGQRRLQSINQIKPFPREEIALRLAAEMAIGSGWP